MSESEPTENESIDDYTIEEHRAGIAVLIFEEIMAANEADSIVIELPDEDYDFEVRKITIDCDE